MPPPPLPRLVIVLQREAGDLALAAWQLQNDNSIDRTPGVPGIADALAWMQAYAPQEGPDFVPTWPGTTTQLSSGGPIAPSGGVLHNTGLFIDPPAGVWSVYEVRAQLLAHAAVSDLGNFSLSAGQIAFNAGPGTPNARVASASITPYAPAVPVIGTAVLTVTAAGELQIGIGNADAVNAQSFELLLTVSGPQQIP